MQGPVLPEIPIPEPLRGSEPGSFAEATIGERLPRIGRRVIAENTFAPEVAARLEALVAQLPHGSIRQLTDVEAPDAAAWATYVAQYEGQSWLEAPWFFSETYFYRRIMEATGYFVDGEGYMVDPFRPHKEQSHLESWPRVRRRGQSVQQWQEALDEPRTLKAALAAALWGNQEDLSMWPGGGEEIPEHGDADAAKAHVLVDDRDAVVAYLQEKRGEGRIDLLMDNAGLELAGDLALVDVLLGGSWADRVVLDVKFHPTFVSDVVPWDVREMMRALVEGEDEALQAWGRRLVAYADSGRLFLRQHPFWTSPLEGWKMPPDVRETLAEAALVISKGDANYRRLLGDRHWPYTTPFQAIMAYFPAPLLALRTLKSDLAAGLDSEQVRALEERDPNWDISGDWGVMQFAP